MSSEIDELMMLYSKSSKHSNYQSLPLILKELVKSEVPIKINRYEQERLNYILSNLPVKEKSVLDIGGNTGYFSIELLMHGASHVHYYEGNKAHVEFVRLAVKLLNLEDKIQISESYYNFEEKITTQQTYDVILLLNVLHHIGDDYGICLSKIDAKELMLKQLNGLSCLTPYLVLQLGFNWKGDPSQGLFENGTKREMIDFIEQGTQGHWSIYKIGIAEEINNTIQYRDLTSKNMSRMDRLGEFLNRPLFILQSQRCKSLCNG